jgi:hypothetical protein
LHCMGPHDMASVVHADLDKVVTITLGGPALIGFRRTLPDGLPGPDTVTEASLVMSCGAAHMPC